LRLRFLLALLVFAVAAVAATRVALMDDYCKPGELKVDLNGTVICAVEVEDYKPIYASFVFQQSGGSSTSPWLACTVRPAMYP